MTFIRFLIKKDSLIPGEAGIQAEDPDIEKIKKLRTDDISCFFGPNVIVNL